MLGTIIGLIIIGLISGFIARGLVPGKQSMTIIQTILLGIAGSPRHAKPQHIDRHAELLKLKTGGLPDGGMPAVARDHQIRLEAHGTLRRSRFHTNSSLAVADQVETLVLHPKLKAGKSLGARGKKIQKIPLRHQRDELRMGRQMPEIGGVKLVIADARAHRGHSLVR